MKLFLKRLNLLILLSLTFAVLGFFENTNVYAASLKVKRRQTWSQKAAQGIIDQVTRILTRSANIPPSAAKLVEQARLLYEYDPIPGKFIDGRITINYDSSLLLLEEFGWFGDWGVDPTLPSPPVGTISEDISWFLQTTPNPQLTVNTEILPPESGSNITTLQVEYDWGTDGYIPSSDNDFNFFGAVFQPIQDTTFGEASSSVTLPNNDFFQEIDITSLNSDDIDALTQTLPNFNRCILSDSEEITLCGVSGSSVPEPSLFLGLITLGFLSLTSYVKKTV